MHSKIPRNHKRPYSNGKRARRALYHMNTIDFLRYLRHLPHRVPNDHARLMLHRPDLMNRFLYYSVMDLAPSFRRHFHPTGRLSTSSRRNANAVIEAILGVNRARRFLATLKTSSTHFSHVGEWCQCVRMMYMAADPSLSDPATRPYSRLPIYPSIAGLVTMMGDQLLDTDGWPMEQLTEEAEAFFSYLGADDRNHRFFFCQHTGHYRRRPSYDEVAMHKWKPYAKEFHKTWRNHVLSEAGISTKGGRGVSYYARAEQLRVDQRVPERFELLYSDIGFLLSRPHLDWMALSCLLLDVDFRQSLLVAEAQEFPVATREQLDSGFVTAPSKSIDWEPEPTLLALPTGRKEYDKDGVLRPVVHRQYNDGQAYDPDDKSVEEVLAEMGLPVDTD